MKTPKQQFIEKLKKHTEPQFGLRISDEDIEYISKLFIEVDQEWLTEYLKFYESFNNYTCDNTERIFLLKKLLKDLEK